MKLCKTSGAASLAIIVAMASSAGIARAERPDLGIDVTQAERIDDSDLGGMRGKFVPGNGQIVFFGITLETSLQTAGGTTETAGFSMGVDLRNGQPTSVTTNTLTSEQTGTGSSGAGGDEFSATLPLNNLSGGVKQIVQVTGQNNTANNTAVIDLSNSPSLLPNLPPSSPCSGCTASITGKGIDIGVDVPGEGSAEQQVGPGSILQAIDLDTNGAMASNLLSLQLQTQPGAGSSLAGLGTILNSIPVLFH
jgi:hypothetical protein